MTEEASLSVVVKAEKERFMARIAKLQALMEQGAFIGFSGCLIFLLENSEVIEVQYSRGMTDVVYHKPKSLVFAGSGSRTLRSPYVTQMHDKAEATLLELFHYACAQDSSSNLNTYSVYGLDENHLYGTVHAPVVSGSRTRKLRWQTLHSHF